MELLKFIGKAILAFLCFVYIAISVVGSAYREVDEDADPMDWYIDNCH